MLNGAQVRVGVCLLGAALAAGMSGCGGDDNSGGASGPDAKLKLGVSSSTLEDPFQAVLQDEVVKAAKAAGAQVLEPTNANGDPAKQLSDVQSLLSQGANGILIAPRDAAAIVPALENAGKRDAKVAMIDVGPQAGKVTVTVRADNVAMGASACKVVGDRLGGRGKVLELQGDLANSSGRDRTDGFERCLEKDFPDIELIARPTKWKADQAANQAQIVLNANKDLKAIYMQSDSVMLAGVLGVLKRAGRDAKVGQPGHITTVAIDGTSLALDSIRSGALDATISQPLPAYAKYGVQYLQEAVRGDKLTEGPSDHDSKVVRDGNGNLEDLLKAPVVTRDNVDDAALWGNKAAAGR